MRRWSSRLCRIAMALAAGSGTVPAAAQHITVDGTLSPSQTLAGPNYAIPAGLGKQVGGNLFQSFGSFGLAPGESATFCGAACGSAKPGTAAIGNVIARVTGGSQSTIEGAINTDRTSLPGAVSVYLINPAGIVFAPGATINVAGSFHAATADYLRLSDGAKFQATSPGGSTLSVAAPAAFGFLNAAPGQITVNQAQLAVTPGQTLGFAGGPVTVENGAVLTAPSGRIYATSAIGPGEVPAARGVPATVTGYGPVAMTNGAALDVQNLAGHGNAGSIIVKAGILSIDGAMLSANNFGSGPGGRISLFGQSQIALSEGAQVTATAFAAGRGADISLTTGPGGSITATGPGNVLVQVGSNNAATGGSGQLSVSTGSLTLSNDAIFGSEVAGAGPTGPIDATAQSIVLDGSAAAPFSQLTGIRSLTTGPANAADIMLSADTVSIRANGEIVTNTSGVGKALATGSAGNVSVAVTGPLSIDATGASVSTGIGSIVSPGDGSVGQAGSVAVTASSLSIVGSNSLSVAQGFTGTAPFAGLSSQTFGPGPGGALNVAVASNVALSGPGPQINAQSSSTGDAGSIALAAQNLEMSGGAAISTASSTVNGGDIVLRIGNLMLLTDSKLTASVASGFGNGGNITIDSPLLVLQRSDIIAQAQRGNGGNITITANDFLPSADSIVSASSQYGVSGTVDVVGPRVDLNGSLVVLPNELRRSIPVLHSACAARGGLPRSSLVQAGRGGLPQDPEAALPALYLADLDVASAAAPHRATEDRRAAAEPIAGRSLDPSAGCEQPSIHNGARD